METERRYITYPANHQPIINVGDELFTISYIASIHYEPAAKVWNELDSENRSFKKDNMMYFCKLIPEVEIVEEIENNKEK